MLSVTATRAIIRQILRNSTEWKAKYNGGRGQCLPSKPVLVLVCALSLIT